MNGGKHHHGVKERRKRKYKNKMNGGSGGTDVRFFHSIAGLSLSSTVTTTATATSL